mmetsp:Transcript_24045/g.74718  ORF Transcript_24045/g.74718 Transcript_24045/m.74718 type:complete len:86 (+) Transcript_24045:1383-1640(+)
MVLALEILHAVIHNSVVKVLTTKVCVTCCCLHLENAFINREQGHVKRPAAHIINEHLVLTSRFLVKAVSNGRSGRLIDDPQDVHP